MSSPVISWWMENEKIKHSHLMDELSKNIAEETCPLPADENFTEA